MSAVIADDTHIDSGVPLHYGNPLSEQRLLRDGALVDLSNRGVVTVTGPDRLSWLHSLTTQHMELLHPQESIHNLILSPHGHIEHDLHIVDDGETTWIITEPGTAPALAAYLDRMRFMLRVEVADVSRDYAVIGSLKHYELSDAVITWVAGDAYTHVHQDDDKYVPVRPQSWTAHEFVVPRAMKDALLANTDVAGTWAWEAARIAAAVPRLHRETDHKTIPHEIGLIAGAVHLNKGCYRGQETIARVHNLGRPPRRLVLLHLDGSDNALPTTGSAVLADGKAVGRVTSATHHYELGPIALAVIKRSTDPNSTLLVSVETQTEDGTEVTEVAATQETVVLP